MCILRLDPLPNKQELGLLVSCLREWFFVVRSLGLYTDEPFSGLRGQVLLDYLCAEEILLELGHMENRVDP